MIFKFWIRSSDRVGCCHLYSAFSFSIPTSGNVDVSRWSPSCSPWVFNFPMILSISSSISYSKNTMVKFSSTVSIINTWFIELEWEMISLDSNGNWLLSNCSHQCFFFINSDLSAVMNSPGLISIIIAATSTDSSVRIFALKSDSMINNIPEWEVHKSSIASIVSIWVRAIN